MTAAAMGFLGAAARRLARSAGRAAAGGSPRAVTRGESPGEGQGEPRALVDWLNLTLKWDGSSWELLEQLRGWFGVPVYGVERPGLHGFTEGLTLWAYLPGAVKDVRGEELRTLELGAVCWGGEGQAGRWLVTLSGLGCGLVRSWWHVRTFCEEQEDVRITRLDLACDLLDGRFTVDDAVRWHSEGGFNCAGRNPKTRTDGDWLENTHGRTLYVGRRTNGKMLRVYEKGKEQGALDSPWVRFEVQFGNRDRVIPFDALTERDKYFAGAYPALEQIVQQAGERIRTEQEDAAISIEWLKAALKNAFGKYVGVLAAAGVPAADIVEEIRVSGLPRRLHVPAVAAGEFGALVKGAFYGSTKQ